MYEVVYQHHTVSNTHIVRHQTRRLCVAAMIAAAEVAHERGKQVHFIQDGFTVSHSNESEPYLTVRMSVI